VSAYIIRTTQIARKVFLPIPLTAPRPWATKLQNLFYLLIPQSLSGKAAGSSGQRPLRGGYSGHHADGVVVAAGVPKSVLAPYEALPFYIYYISSQYTSPEELMNGYGAALILLLLCLFLFTLAFVIKKRLTYLAFYRP
jgi:phosphate transport system permease protein